MNNIFSFFLGHDFSSFFYVETVFHVFLYVHTVFHIEISSYFYNLNLYLLE